MYIIRRTYKAKIGEARNAALLLRRIADIYTEAGQRNKCSIYYNGGTLPCPKDELNRIYMGISTYNQDAQSAADKVLMSRLNGFHAVSIFSYDSHKHNLDWFQPVIDSFGNPLD